MFSEQRRHKTTTAHRFAESKSNAFDNPENCILIARIYSDIIVTVTAAVFGYVVSTVSLDHQRNFIEVPMYKLASLKITNMTLSFVSSLKPPSQASFFHVLLLPRP
jgi:hypothetical protein